jgi:hypothetical protein
MFQWYLNRLLADPLPPGILKVLAALGFEPPSPVISEDGPSQRIPTEP